MNPSVITSKSAKQDLLKIKGYHADMVTGMANQKMQSDAYNQQKQAELANRNAMQAEMDKAQMTANTEAQKNALDFAQKQSEIDIKRAALSMK